MGRIGRWIGALSLILAVAGCDTKRPAALEKVREGTSRAQVEEYVMAMRLFDEAIEIDPACGEAFLRKGILQLEYDRDASAAIVPLQRATELMPDSADAFYQLGSAQLAAGDLASAARSLESANRIDPSHANALFRRGQVSERQGETLVAIEHYSAAIRSSPREPQGYDALGALYARFGRFLEASAVFANGIQNNPGSASLHAAAGAAALDAGELDQAVTWLEAAESLVGAPAAASHNLAVALATRFERSRNEADRLRAVEALGRALTRCNPGSEPARCQSLSARQRELVDAGAPNKR